MFMLRSELYINSSLMTPYVHSFRACIKNSFFSTWFPFKKRLKFHGLAFGASIDPSANLLSLNVGYTSTLQFMLPTFLERLRLSNTGRKLLFESRMLNLIASFVTELRNVRPVSIYFNPAKRGGRRGIRLYLTFVRRKKFNKDVK